MGLPGFQITVSGSQGAMSYPKDGNMDNWTVQSSKGSFFFL